MNRKAGQNKLFGMDITDLLKNFCLQWKAVLIVCILVAAVVSGAKYYKEQQSYNALRPDKDSEQAADPQIVGEKIDAILANLKEDDRLAVEHVLRQGKWLKDRNEYMDKSILMSLDPYSLKTVSVGFNITDVTDESMITGLSFAYASAFDSDEAADTMGALIAPEAERQYIRELISFRNDDVYSDVYTSNTVEVNVTVPDDCDENRIIDAVKILMSNKSKELSESIAVHKLEFAYSGTLNVVNNEVVDRRNATINWISNIQGLQNNALASLNETQAAAYAQITALETTIDQDAQLDGLETASDSQNMTKPHIRKKYILMGFILGFLAYVFIFLAYFMLNGRLNSSSAAEYITGSRMLGRLAVDKEKAGPLHKIMNSRIVASVIDRIEKNGSSDENKIITSISSICKHIKNNNVSIINLTDETGANDEKLKEMANRLVNNEINTAICEAGQFETEEIFLNIKNAVFALDKNTKERDLERIVSLCKAYDVNTIGYIFFGE